MITQAYKRIRVAETVSDSSRSELPEVHRIHGKNKGDNLGNHLVGD